jgi:hypothetical protein
MTRYPFAIRIPFLASVCGLAAFATSGMTPAAEILRPASERFAVENPQETPSFQRHVLPLMGRLGCNGRACHGSFQGQGGFRLSLFGYDFKTDHDALLLGDEPRVDLKNPTASLMIEKPTGNEDSHGGGHRLDVGSWQYRLMLKWITSGAKGTDEEKDPQFVRLEVTPTEIVFRRPGETAQLRVVSHWSDGSVEDVTPICRFQTNDDAVAKVNESGLITVAGKGDTHVVAFYDNGVVPVSVLLPVSDQVGPNYPAVPTPTKIDELVTAKLRKLGVVPSDVCTDAEFLRRVSLDITGILPTSDEIKTFLADKASDKRTRKVNELLEKPAYSAWWATKLCDILGNSENQLKKNNSGPGSYSEQWYRWTERRLAENTHYDDIVEGVVLAVSRSSDKQTYEEYCREMASYGLEKDQGKFAERATMPHYWARNNMRKPNERALSFSYAFLGVRLQCAECHKHPFDQWSQQDFQQFTAFFNRVSNGNGDPAAYRKLIEELGLGDKKLNNGDKQRILSKSAEAGKTVPYQEVYITASSKGRRDKNDKGKQVDASRVITPKVLGGEEVVDGNYDDPRQPLMDWLRQKDNPYFAKAFVNRIWAGYFNTGIVEPPDDMNLANAPSNKELLDYLAAAFIEHDYDIKWLHREIVNSTAYQRSWVPNATNEHDLRNYSHAVPRRLPAEVVYDAVVTATAGSNELVARDTNPLEKCAIGMSRGYSQRQNNNSQYALMVFGKPKRETPCDCERSNEPSLLQTVFLRNDRDMFTMIERRDGWLTDLARNAAPVASDKKSDKGVDPKLAEEVSDLEKRYEKAKKRNETETVALLRSKMLLAREQLNAQKKKGSDPKAAAVQVAAATPKDLVTEAYLRTFSRLPDADELARGQKYLAESPDQASGLRDLLWALLNSKEFVVNH